MEDRLVEDDSKTYRIAEPGCDSLALPTQSRSAIFGNVNARLGRGMESIPDE